MYVWNCCQLSKGVRGCAYNVNSWILNVHLQYSVVVPVIFIRKKGINATVRTILSTHISGCLIWDETYFNSYYNYSNYTLLFLLFFTLHWVLWHSDYYLESFNCALSLMPLCAFFLPLFRSMITEAVVKIVNQGFDSILGANFSKLISAWLQWNQGHLSSSLLTLNWYNSYVSHVCFKAVEMWKCQRNVKLVSCYLVQL